MDLGQSVGSVGSVGKSSSFSFSGEYSEAQAQNWLDNEAPPEAKELYQKKFENMHKTMTEQTSRDLALKRTWEYFHK